MVKGSRLSLGKAISMEDKERAYRLVGCLVAMADEKESLDITYFLSILRDVKNDRLSPFRSSRDSHWKYVAEVILDGDTGGETVTPAATTEEKPQW